jgi:hypothetical protein
VPKVGDLWILVFIVCPHHLIRLFLPRIDNLFIVGNKVVRVEHLGIKSKALVWRLGRWLWNFEHDDKVQYESQSECALWLTKIQAMIRNCIKKS